MTTCLLHLIYHHQSIVHPSISDYMLAPSQSDTERRLYMKLRYIKYTVCAARYIEAMLFNLKQVVLTFRLGVFLIVRLALLKLLILDTRTTKELFLIIRKRIEKLRSPATKDSFHFLQDTVFPLVQNSNRIGDMQTT